MNEGTTILLIEDDDVAAEAVERSLRKNGIALPLVHAANGVVALELLRSTPGLRDMPRIILLDLNMPRMNGFEFLREIRADPALSDLVVFVLTTSDAPADRVRAYEEHIAGYMVKSQVGVLLGQLAALLRTYSEIVILP
jgi:CheY-like chemotaxis protein